MEVPALTEEQVKEQSELPPGDDAPVSVTDIVDDLLSPADPDRDRQVEDATVVEGSVDTEESAAIVEPPAPSPDADVPDADVPDADVQDAVSPARPEPPAPPADPFAPPAEPPAPPAEPPAPPQPPAAPIEERVVRPPSDPDLALAVRSKLAEQPGLLPGTVDLEVISGVVILRGEARHVETINELVRRAGDVPGVQEVRNLLRLPGNPDTPAEG
jgi:hypothetical protein